MIRLLYEVQRRYHIHNSFKVGSFTYLFTLNEHEALDYVRDHVVELCNDGEDNSWMVILQHPLSIEPFSEEAREYKGVRAFAPNGQPLSPDPQDARETMRGEVRYTDADGTLHTWNGRRWIESPSVEGEVK